MKKRIELTDNVRSAILKMCDGNPGALDALIQVAQHAEKIDPQGAMGGFGAILMLDTLGIYGTNIYILYNDVCDRKVSRLIAILRACQLGFLDHITIQSASKKQDRSGKDLIPVEELYQKVKERLVDFDLV